MQGQTPNERGKTQRLHKNYDSEPTLLLPHPGRNILNHNQQVIQLHPTSSTKGGMIHPELKKEKGEKNKLTH